MKAEDKLEIFYKIAVKEAKEKSRALLKEVDGEYKKTLGEAAAAAHRQADQMLAAEKEALAVKRNRELAERTAEAQKAVNRRREQLTDRLFQNVRVRLEQFINTPEYAEALSADIRVVTSRYPQAELTLMARDMLLASKLHGSIEETEEDFIGGFKAFIPEKNGFLDNSYLGKLEEERKRFGAGAYQKRA